jgi:uncharacterized protein (DUF2252 family)
VADKRDPRRSEHGRWEPPADRADPIAILERQGRDRAPELLPIRHGRMLASRFAFFRGAAAIMAADLATTPTLGLDVQLCGDAHLANFGVFAAPDRRLVFDLNDFDETHPGPWEWDVKRLAASVAVLAGDLGFDEDEQRGLAVLGARSYREAMRSFAQMGTLAVWYDRAEIGALLEQGSRPLSATERKRLDRALARAQRKDSSRALTKLTHMVDDRPRIVSDPPLIVPLNELVAGGDLVVLQTQVLSLLKAYRETLDQDRRHLLGAYEAVDAAHKVVGVGSVGLRAWVALLLGREDQEPLFLQLKEARTSVIAPHVRARVAGNQGRRVVLGQRLMQAASDIFLGWTHVSADVDGRQRDYYVRQLWDAKGAARLEDMSVNELTVYMELCGWTLARAHARSGDRRAIAAYLGASDNFDRAIGAFALTYARVNADDHEQLVQAVSAGRLAADTEH